MNYEYEVVLSNGKVFFATSKDRLSSISRRIRDYDTVIFDNAVVSSNQIAAVVVWNGKPLFGPTT